MRTYYAFALVISSILVIGLAEDSLQQQTSSLTDALRRSPLTARLVGRDASLLRHHLDVISKAPCSTFLKNATDLLYGAAEFCKQQLSEFPTLDENNLEAWLQASLEFLSSHANSTRSMITPTNNSIITIPSSHLSGLPMVRRSLLAQLVRSWTTGLGEQLPERLAPYLGKLVSLMYGIHTDSVVHRGAIQYLHISKSGGTAWNDAARANGCVFPNTLGNHVRGFNDECRWLDPHVYGSFNQGRLILWARWGTYRRAKGGSDCWSRFRRVAGAGLSYFSNEYTLVGGREPEGLADAQSCPQFVNVVTLRNPLRRMESALRFIQLYIRGYWVRDDPNNGLNRYRNLFCNATAELWRKLAPPVTDNYIVRSFLGEGGFHTPPGLLGAPHLIAAREQLLQFDLVLDLEAGSGTNDWLVQQGLGWPAAWSKANRTLNSTLLSRYMGRECSLRPEVLAELSRDQDLDVRMYKFSQVVNQLDALWLDMSRALGLQPDVQPGALDPGAAAHDIRCGMLWRGADASSLALAMGLQLEPSPPPPAPVPPAPSRT